MLKRGPDILLADQEAELWEPGPKPAGQIAERLAADAVE